MSGRIPLDYKCIYKDRISGNTVGKADSNFHAVIWRPVGGVTNEQIQLLYQQFRKDLGEGHQELQNAVLLASKEKIWTDTYILH